MNPDPNTLPGSAFEPDGNRPETMSATRPMYWSVRRELWENRSIYLAPLIVAAVVLFGSFIATVTAASRARSGAPSTTGKARTAVAAPIAMAPAPIMLASFLVGFLYCLDALYGERRDRSILFWKSLPVSDRTTVLSKASIPLVVLPLIAFALSLATVLILLPVTIAAWLARGVSLRGMWAALPEPAIMIYGLTVHALWFAPIYCWVLLISAWARRAPILWVILPPLAIAALERMAFNSTYFMYMLQYRITGAMKEAFRITGNHSFDKLEPLNFLSTPGLWVGLLFAAGCLVAAVRLRVNREPI
ncbi:MAG TPA: ABC transporter permease [Thermoanaerobaculia bacterium]|nr:ABC transporter permease [Thermoanaerobaculia bacterium]